MNRSIPHACVARRLNSLLFALLAPCHAGASTPENVNLFLSEPYVTLYSCLSLLAFYLQSIHLNNYKGFYLPLIAGEVTICFQIR
jgi:hypothetical protein